MVLTKFKACKAAQIKSWNFAVSLGRDGTCKLVRGDKQCLPTLSAQE